MEREVESAVETVESDVVDEWLENGRLGRRRLPNPNWRNMLVNYCTMFDLPRVQRNDIPRNF